MEEAILELDLAWGLCRLLQDGSKLKGSSMMDGLNNLHHGGQTRDVNVVDVFNEREGDTSSDFFKCTIEGSVVVIDYISELD